VETDDLFVVTGH